MLPQLRLEPSGHIVLDSKCSSPFGLQNVSGIDLTVVSALLTHKPVLVTEALLSILTMLIVRKSTTVEVVHTIPSAGALLKVQQRRGETLQALCTAMNRLEPQVYRSRCVCTGGHHASISHVDYRLYAGHALCFENMTFM